MVTYTSGREREEDPNTKYIPGSILTNPDTKNTLVDILTDEDVKKLEKTYNNMKINTLNLLKNTKDPLFLDTVTDTINQCHTREMFEKILELVIDWYVSDKDAQWLNENIVNNGGYFQENFEEFTNKKSYNKIHLYNIFKWYPLLLSTLHPFPQLKNKEKELWSPEQKLFDSLASHAFAYKSALFENKEWRFSGYGTGFHGNKVKDEIQSYFSNNSEVLDKIHSAFAEHKTVVFRFNPNGTYFNVCILSEQKGKISEQCIFSSSPENASLQTSSSGFGM